MARQNRPRAKMNIPVCLACVLLCLTLVSIRLSSGVVARYSTTADSGDSARVIRFGDLTLTEYGGDPQYIAPGVTLEWNASVSFTGSESATFVFVEVSGVESGADGTVTLFDDVDFTVADGWEYLDSYTKDDVTKYVYYRALEPNVEMTNVALFANGSAVVPESLTAEQIAAMSSISTKFRASVVQSNGFANAAAAWESLEEKHS